MHSLLFSRTIFWSCHLFLRFCFQAFPLMSILVHVLMFYSYTLKLLHQSLSQHYLLSVAGITHLPEPDVGDKYSGKLLMSLLIPEGINYSEKTDFYSLDKEEGQVKVENGVLVQGALDNKSYREIGEQLTYLKGYDAGREFVNRSTLLGLTTLKIMGFSLGYREYELHDATQKKIKEIINNAEREIDAIVLKYKNKTLKRAPGLTLKETLENKILEINGKTRKLCGNTLDYMKIHLIAIKICIVWRAHCRVYS